MFKHYKHMLLLFKEYPVIKEVSAMVTNDKQTEFYNWMALQVLKKSLLR